MHEEQPTRNPHERQRTVLTAVSALANVLRLVLEVIRLDR